MTIMNSLVGMIAYTGLSIVFVTEIFGGKALAAEFHYRFLPIDRLTPYRVYIPYALNDSGQVVGMFDLLNGTYAGARREHPSGDLTILPAIAACGRSGTPLCLNSLGATGGAIANCPVGDSQQATFWNGASAAILIGYLVGDDSRYSTPTAINDYGTVVGHARSANAGTEAFVWDAENGMRGLGDLPGGEYHSVASDVNIDGFIVGSSPAGFDSDGGFIVPPGQKMMNFREWAGLPFRVYSVSQINNAGQVLGYGQHPELGPRYFFWDPQIGHHWMISQLTGEPSERVSADSLNELGWVNCTIYTTVDFTTLPVMNAIWDIERGFRAIPDLIDPCETRDRFRATYSLGINNHGWMIAINNPATGHGLLIPYLPGDLDPIEGGGGTYPGDGDVDLQDLAILLSNFGRSGDSTYATGDLDCDRDTDLEDLGILLGNFGESLP